MNFIDLRDLKSTEIISILNRGFSQNEREFYILANCDIFDNISKMVILSTDTIQSHLHHSDITAEIYAKIPSMLNAKKDIFIQNDIIYIVLSVTDDENFRLTLKNIINKNEIFVSSLVRLSKHGGFEKEQRKLSKKYKRLQG